MDTAIYYENGIAFSDPAVRQLFGQVVTHNPEELVDILPPDATPDSFADAVVQHMTPQLPDHGHHGSIRNALADTIVLLNGAFDDAPQLTKDEALTVTRSEITHCALAELALRKEDSLRLYAASPNRKLIYRINDARTRLIIGPGLQADEGGCPYAGRIEGTKRETRDPDPFFFRFASWAGEVAVHRYFGSPIAQ